MSHQPSKSNESQCVFCDRSKIKSVINDYGDVIAFEPLNPVVKGHLLVVPKKHVTDFTEDVDVTARVMQQAGLIAGYLGGEYNLITSKGKSATQSVFHLHVHLVPRTENDDLLLPWTGKEAIQAKDAEREKAVEAERERIRQLLPKRDTGFNLCLDRVYDALMPPEVSNDTEHECHCDVHDCCSVHKVSNDTP